MQERTLFYTKLTIAFFLICWVSMVYRYVSDSNREIEFTRYEQKGATYHNALMQLIKHIQEDSELDVVYYNGDHSLKSDIDAVRTVINKDVENIDKLNPDIGAKLKATESWDRIKKRLAIVHKDDEREKAEQGMSYHVSIVNDLLQLMQYTADTSNLILDPELSSYYLMNLNVKIIPYLTDNINKMLNKTSVLLMNPKQEVSMQEKVEFLILHGSVNNLSEQMLYAYSVLEGLPNKTKDSYASQKNVILQIQPKFLNKFYEVVVEDNRDVSSKDILDEGKKVTGEYFKVYQQNAEELHDVLQSRIDSYVVKRNFLVIFSIAVSIGIIIFYYVFRINLLRRAKAESEIMEANENLEKQVQERIAEFKQQKSLFESIVENIPLAVFAKDAKNDYRWITLNKKGEELFCLNGKEVIGSRDYDIFPKDQADFMHKEELSVMMEGKIVEVDEEIISTPKGKFTAHIIKVPVYDEEGSPSIMMTIFEDITDRQKAQERLRMLQAAVENYEDVVILTDTQLDNNGPIVLYVNPAIKNISGYSPEEVIGKSVNIIHNKSLEDRRMVALEKSLREGRSYHGELLNYDKEGKEYWTFINAFPVPDENGNITSFAAIERDITREREMRNELIRSKKLAEAANQTKTDFLANMSHELRTPLNSILGMTRILKESNLNPEQRELVRTVFQSSLNLLEIVNDILDLSKIEAGEVELENIGFDINYLMKSVTQAMSLLAIDKNLEFIENIERNMPFVSGDPTRLNRILHNLIGNAVKYTLEGKVEIRTTYKQIDEFHIKWVCEVIDSGIGIPENKIDHIFDKFTQADISTTRKFGGTGLGLTITKELVELMGGKIEVESEVGVGSTFRVKIPFQVTETIFQEKVRRKDVVNKGTIAPDQFRVLVAEDHPLNKLLIEKVMEKLGIKNFYVAENGIEVLRVLEEKTYDVIFMDCHMPEKNGYDTTEDIRRREYGTGSHIPIIAMTANAMVGDREICLRCGMDDYISKPIDIDELTDIMSQWVKFPNKENIRAGNKDGKEQLIDLSLLDTFTNGDKEVEKEFLNLFLMQSDKNLLTLKANLVDGECKDWVEAAHQLKGGAANMGAERLRALSEMSQNMHNASAKDREKIYNDIEEIFIKIKKYINEQYLCK